jgi:hypothetical protein
MNLLPPGVLGGPDVIVGVRPEHVRLTPDGAHLATVRLVEPLGHETLVTCELIGAVASGSRLIARLRADEVAPVAGQDVLVDLPEDRRHRFSATTGERLEAIMSADDTVPITAPTDGVREDGRGDRRDVVPDQDGATP